MPTMYRLLTNRLFHPVTGWVRTNGCAVTMGTFSPSGLAGLVYT